MLLLFLIGLSKVEAESISDYDLQQATSYKINSSGTYTDITPRYSTFQVTNANNQLFIKSQAYLSKMSGDTNQANEAIPKFYQRITFCADKNTFTSGWNVENADMVKFVNTSIPCKLTNAPNYNNSYIAFSTMRTSLLVEDLKCNNIGICTRMFESKVTQIASTIQINTSWTILANEWSLNDFPEYDSTSSKFEKLDSILEAINTLISNSNNSGVISAITNQTTSITNAQNQTTNAINDMANEDLDNNTKQQVDSTNINDYNTKEANLMNTATSTTLNDVNIGIDNQASNSIWQLVTRILNTNSKIFGLVISILSIGIIKLMLSR